jgi:two-component system chemotaxis response regulator CheY
MTDMNLKILIVDDSSLMRAFVERVIRISGLTADCVKVSNGHEALGVLRKEKVDLVLTDISMPGMDGETLLSRIRAEDRIAHTPVVVLSSDVTDNRVLRMAELGASGYLSKPVQPARLRDELERLFKNYA